MFLKNDFTRGNKTKENDLIIIQIYVDDILFGATNNNLCVEFSLLMTREFEISIMGELTFFIGLQIKQCNDGIFINQSKYANELLKKYKMDQAKHAKILMAMSEKLDLDKDGKPMSERFIVE